ncbi:MAG: AraC family transcriptional regulator [Luteibacter sp.]|uniref:AraC family transcriptional regulator n=1 Tax=Rhodanobacteraceae TaxID=1775411 RepID=UPI0005B82C02|nr:MULTISPECIES: AraC family transcriptional regulator [Rhodanobacteraceae]MDQ7995082.1 AraC family transcriptional regulator [Luteibacter sp.]MDQ8047403.1 AraC family transcriptional regulator [Luteibacter sp.]SDF47609.1 AraC-type DNA-binding protein [Dyella sp. 333MFSha]
MVDPLADVVTLLQPKPTFSKAVSAAGPWRVRRKEAGQPFYCVILDGSSRMQTNGEAPITLEAGDFILIPEAFDFTMSGLVEVPDDAPDSLPAAMPDGRFRLGTIDAPADVEYLIGHCAFGSPDADLLVSLLPRIVLVRGERRLATLVELLRDESRAQRPARDVVLAHLLELLFIEALRSTGTAASPGLVRGLTDARLALALRQMHASPEKPWTVVELAKIAALSRSVFFERFSRAVGVAPMEYLLSWRMALARRLLRGKDMGVATVAGRVGYSSASAFSVAFARHVGMPPTQFRDA